MAEAPKPTAEREQTDESLRDEREKTDRAIAEGRDLVQESADEVLRRAREEADAVLEQAREKADALVAHSSGSPSAEAGIAIERKVEDATVRADRATADQVLEIERIETARILARLLPSEREETDERLSAERVQSDGAIANRDDFLGVVAHDLRDLMGSIAMCSAVIAKVCGDPGHHEQVRLEVGRIQRSAARANRLIGDLVDVASIDAGRLSIVKTRDHVRPLLREASEEFRASAIAKDLDLTVEDDGSVLVADFDHARLFQVLGNLIINAIKFSPRGGRIVVRAERAAGDVLCSVRDQGPGIPPDQIEKVFDRFVQVHKDDRRGLGLGLYIAKRIVVGHQGRIWAECRPGQGTLVLFTIPAPENESTQAESH